MSNVSLINGHIDGSETCDICGREIPEGRQECVICGYKPKKQTNYDRIRNMGVEELAEFLNELNYQTGCKIPTNCLARECNDCVKLWLESESDTK